MSPKYKLTYFPLRGLAEPIRFVLAYLKVDFEDFRIDFGDWPDVKSKNLFAMEHLRGSGATGLGGFQTTKAMKAHDNCHQVVVHKNQLNQSLNLPTQNFKAPYGKLPYFQIDGKVVTQSIALTRYFGRKAGIAGDNIWEDLLIDMAVDIFRDFQLEFNNWITEEDDTVRANKKEKLVNEILPFYMKKLDALVKENGGYLANNKLSWGDLYFVSVIDFFCETIGAERYLEYENLKNLYDKVNNLPSIKSWLERRPKDKQNIFNKN